MKCCECGGEYKNHTNTKLRVDDDAVGTFYVDGVSYQACGSCGARLFAPEDAKKIEAAREKTLETLLLSQPIGGFLTVAEAVKLLGVTRQAFHKNRRIARGFIYQIPFGDKKVYLKESVERYRRKGDGRFPLRPLEEKLIGKAKFSLGDIAPRGAKLELGVPRRFHVAVS
ncbi:MAG: hypothetical protein LBW77_06705 [Verrucomicrobiota bacterium]|jgi:hypothetical protein|nr:hypothetical protein [Verrucomicrobiota bacterium]